MATKIEWCDEVFNPVTGCTPISPGCDHCFARRMATRLKGRSGYPAENPFAVTLHPDRLEKPFSWRKPRRVFVCSMSDLFHEKVPDEYLFDVFGVIAACSYLRRHTFMVLTKRPERMKSFLTADKLHRIAEAASTFGDGVRNHGRCRDAVIAAGWPLPNLWLGVTAENQQTADERIPLLLQTPAAVRFISAEPLLGPITLAPWLGHPRLRLDGKAWAGPDDPPGLHLAILGGETGPGARPMHPDWVRDLRDQCVDAGVPFFFKNWGAFIPYQYRPGEMVYAPRAKNHILDGREWRELPGGIA